MQLSRRDFVATVTASGAASGLIWNPAAAAGGLTYYVRYEQRGKRAYGLLEKDTIREIRGGLFGARKPTGAQAKLAEVKLLYPCEPTTVLAVGLNYKSHLGNRPAPTKPELFFKPVTSLVEPGGEIVIPPGAQNVHYEGEFVIVIGKTAHQVKEGEALQHVFGYTCGNDVSERNWQQDDLQWWRAKGADTFGPLGPAIVTGLEYHKSRLQTRVNGVVKQSQLLSDLLFDVPAIVSFASQHVTLHPGDVIYTGTPGATSAMKPGDVVEVEIQGIGVLRNPVK
jgi:2-keto-4-pentenoate hydratase/2-oxohepta-3-ene-1,7-dioic acid hydratase in catechol pathway